MRPSCWRNREIEVSQSVSLLWGINSAFARAAHIAHNNTIRQHANKEKVLLLGELDHRVKNILTIVSSIVRRTLHTSSSPEKFVTNIQGRIQALACAHGLLTQDGAGGGSLRTLLATKLESYDEHGTRLRLDGPEIILTPKAGLVLAMAIHELATNAAKHGALSLAEGRLLVD